MKLYIGADHRGFELKQAIVEDLQHDQVGVVDVGAWEYEPEDDFVDFAEVAMKQMDPEVDRAVLLCGSGHGMDIVANRHVGIRAIIGFNMEVVVQGRQHEDANVLVIPADWTNKQQATEMVRAFLQEPFSDLPKYNRRLKKIERLGL